MVIDTSAVVALMCDEPDAERFEVAIASAAAPCMSVGSVLECTLVLEGRYGPTGGLKLDQLIAEQGIEVVAFDLEQLALARAAFRRFGRGHHPASLNFGDCFAYALAKQRAEPLLFQGSDFEKTDIASAIDE